LGDRKPQLVLLAVGVAILTFAAVGKLATPIAEGQLIDWLPNYSVERVRVLGQEFYVDTSAGTQDTLTAILLGSAAAVLAVAAVVLHRREGDRSVIASFAVVASFFLFLALDEVLAAHETVGNNLGVLRPLPGVDHPDDLIIALYGVTAIVLAWRHRHIARRASQRTQLLLVAAAVAGSVAVGIDSLFGRFDRVRLGRVEEVAELTCAVLLAAAIVSLVTYHLRESATAR
jgi:hypothetical protein